MKTEFSLTRASSRRGLKRMYGPTDLAISERVVLDLCGGTGAWSRPYVEAGYKVVVVDPAFGTDDVRLFRLPDYPVHGILAAPPCTVFSWASHSDRTETEILSSLSVVDACLRIAFACNPTWWALENPRGRLIYFLGRPLLSFQPWWYGDGWTKRTHVWGKFAIPVRSPVPVTKPGYITKLSGSREHAVTPAGFAKSFFEANP